MLQIEPIILYCLKQLDSERTIYSVYHLLNGKKSSQTIQDAHLYSLKKFFGIYESLTRESFEEIIQSLLKKKWIYPSREQRFLVTSLGKSVLTTHPLPYFMNGWKYHLFTSQVWERLSLFIQVTSNLVYQEARYVPIQKNKDVHKWLKAVLKEVQAPRKEVGSLVFFELVDCFNDATEIDPSLLVFRLTGFQQIGLTPMQAAQKLHMEIHDYHIGFIHTLHYLIQKINCQSNRFRILSLLFHDLQQDNELTHSSQKTWALLKQGYSLDMIATYRHLKLSTIEDHLVEFALNIDNFPIDDYVDKELQTKILEISRDSATRQLKIIREKLKTATYFQIRLVLAKYGGR
ncbi:hypothetical protein BACCIP111895_02887 [Neobacillus rhizosphaerae]|uniref:Helicase Helix-turn-helix domain-containing protein n=1 Tax=Neobacillus rhizosphaerae TaxID=2880965 RepID=A0ABM9ESV0_9BACI|nr:helix-turn-helix domain-containing protein [Neobacillus rhizosphaerae]CAH2715703.1 hypothetical protein BACCIP111895_02887 [Neobacillus rhizosphaerae]